MNQDDRSFKFKKEIVPRLTLDEYVKMFEHLTPENGTFIAMPPIIDNAKHVKGDMYIELVDEEVQRQREAAYQDGLTVLGVDPNIAEEYKDVTRYDKLVAGQKLLVNPDWTPVAFWEITIDHEEENPKTGNMVEYQHTYKVACYHIAAIALYID